MKSINILLVILVLIGSVSLARGEMDFTYSAADLSRLSEAESKISKTFEDLESVLTHFASILDSERRQKKAIEFPTEEIIQNPLLSYLLLKRHVQSLKELDRSFDEFVSKLIGLNESYQKLRTTFVKPGEADLKNAMEAIIRLRQTYNLPVLEGNIANRKIQGSLNGEDMIHIGIYAKESRMTVNARQFLEVGLRQLALENIPPENKLDLVKTAERALAALPENSSVRADREDFRVLTEMDTIFATDSMERLNAAFENLCQIHTVKDVPPSKYKCYLDRGSSPVRQIAPLKLEVYHENPQIVVIYDVLSDTEMDEINSATFYKLKRSLIQVYQDKSLTIEPSIIRTTSQAWIHDEGHPQFGYLGKRIESITGYNITGKYSAEDLQVASYRPGGHYSLHTDATQEELLKPFLNEIDLMKGDRLVTFMFYLSDVEMGGNTVFPMLNVSVKPVKGSAIVWGNLYPDGNIARNTLHGACPVLIGIKNIATKWIRANNQMFTRHKCKKDKSMNHYNLKE